MEGNNEKLKCLYLTCIIPIDNYHRHLPDKTRRSLQEFLMFFSIIQYIAIEIENVAINNMNKDENINVNYFLFKIKNNQLIKYIKIFSGETIENIKSFLEYVSSKGDKSFWIKPILAGDLCYFFSIHHIICANIFNIIDIWLNENRDYNDKGRDFENF
jgi:hypothetical protein